MSESRSSASAGLSAPSSGSGAVSRGPRPRLFRKDRCQADGCNTDLRRMPWYHRRNHICLDHKVADDFHRLGDHVRFCQRCGVAHELGDFDGLKKSCRRMLEKHNARRRKASAATTPASSAGNEPSSRGAAAPPVVPAAAAEATSPLLLLPLVEEPVLLFTDEIGGGGALHDELLLGPAVRSIQPAVAVPAAGDSQRAAAPLPERVCCATADERICGPLGAAAAAAVDAQPLAAELRDDDGAAGSAAPGAAPDAAADECSSAVHDDPHPHARPSHQPLTAPSEAALAALQRRDAAMYAYLVEQQLLRAQTLLVAASMVARAAPALPVLRSVAACA